MAAGAHHCCASITNVSGMRTPESLLLKNTLVIHTPGLNDDSVFSFQKFKRCGLPSSDSRKLLSARSCILNQNLGNLITPRMDCHLKKLWSLGPGEMSPVSSKSLLRLLQHLLAK